MAITYLNSQPSFSDVAFSIECDPASWQEWSCLNLSFEAEEIDQAQLEKCAGSYFGSLDGRLFIVQHNLYVVCRNISAEILRELGRQALRLRLDGKVIFKNLIVFDLGFEADLFLSSLFFKQKRRKIPPASKSAHRRSEVKKILLVEDDPLSARLFSLAVGRGHKLITAASGEKACELYETWNPDIVFLDIGLPDSDGFSVLRWIIHEYHDANIIMLSGHSDIDNIAAAFDQGAQGFIAKPFKPEKLKYYIEKNTRKQCN